MEDFNTCLIHQQVRQTKGNNIEHMNSIIKIDLTISSLFIHDKIYIYFLFKLYAFITYNN